MFHNKNTNVMSRQSIKTDFENLPTIQQQFINLILQFDYVELSEIEYELRQISQYNYHCKLLRLFQCLEYNQQQIYNNNLQYCIDNK